MSFKNPRIIRTDKKLKSRLLNTSKIGGGGDCPAITLADFDTNIMFTSGDFLCLSSISGGVPEYVLEVTSGSIPPNTEIINSGTAWAVLLDGTTTTFGTYTFTIGGTDANGCPITPKEFTIEVWAEFAGTPVEFTDLNSTVTFDSISGLPTTLGTGVEIYSIEVDAIVADATLADMTCIFVDLLDSAVMNIFNDSQLTGDSLIQTVFSIDGSGLISAGTPPYTSEYSDSQVSGSFASFDGLNPNDGFYINLHQQIGSAATGGFLTGTIIFKPI